VEGAPDAFTVATTVGSSSARAGNGSTLGGWGRGSGGTMRALNTKCFKGAKLSTLVLAYLRENRKMTSTNKPIRKIYNNTSEIREPTSWSAFGLSSPGVLTSPAWGPCASSPPTQGLLCFGCRHGGGGSFPRLLGG
jgi:hypothetical protein